MVETKKNSVVTEPYGPITDEFNIILPPKVPSTILLPYGANKFQKLFWTKMISQSGRIFKLKVDDEWI